MKECKSLWAILNKKAIAFATTFMWEWRRSNGPANKRDWLN